MEGNSWDPPCGHFRNGATSGPASSRGRMNNGNAGSRRAPQMVFPGDGASAPAPSIPSDVVEEIEIHPLQKVRGPSRRDPDSELEHESGQLRPID
jgi:hypothetical protein